MGAGPGPFGLLPLLELDAGDSDFPLQRGNLDLLPAQQDVLVIRRAQALQQGGDGAVAGSLFAPLHAGDGRGIADALAQLPLGQPQVLSSLSDVVAKEDHLHNSFLRSYHSVISC